jgi:hypothetical protein
MFASIPSFNFLTLFDVAVFALRASTSYVAAPQSASVAAPAHTASHRRTPPALTSLHSNSGQHLKTIFDPEF